MSEPFIGEIKAVGFNWSPYGYAFANGAIIQITQNQALYSLVGTFYGGDGRSTFGLPNLQSRVVVGMYARGTPLGLTPYQIGNFGGNEAVNLSLAQLPNHTHDAVTEVTADTTVTPNSSGLGATTAINTLTAPSAKLQSPSGNLLTGASDSVNGNAVAAYAAPGTGSAATLAPTAATTTITGSVSATATTAATAVTTIGATGASAAVDLRVPFLALNYIIATNGVYPQRN